jgi:hypothetical protein
LGYLSPRQPAGLTPVPIPTYLLHRIGDGLAGQSGRNPSTFIVDVLGRALAEEEELAGLTVDERASIERRLKALGYLD